MQALSGQPVKCTVSHDGGTTTYALQTEFSDKDVQKPEFSWFNVSVSDLSHICSLIYIINFKGFHVICIYSGFCRMTG